MPRKIEEVNQVVFVTWFRYRYPSYSDLLTLGSFGENIGEKRMKRLKEMGLTPGYPDLFFAMPRFKYMDTSCGPFITYPFYAGLFIEMKTKTGRVKKNQALIHEKLRKKHYKVDVARSWEEAKNIIEDYLITD